MANNELSGLALDRAIAEAKGFADIAVFLGGNELFYRLPNGLGQTARWRTDYNAAMGLFRELRDSGLRPTVEVHDGDVLDVSIRRYNEGTRATDIERFQDDDERVAICRAWLEAHEAGWLAKGTNNAQG